VDAGERSGIRAVVPGPISTPDPVYANYTHSAVAFNWAESAITHLVQRGLQRQAGIQLIPDEPSGWPAATGGDAKRTSRASAKRPRRRRMVLFGGDRC
jgi:hypothetical protein